MYSGISCSRGVRAVVALFLVAISVEAEPRRLVLLKLDGVPMGLIEQYLAERVPASEPGRGGKSRLPWIEEVFRKRGVTFDNFYVRGISLSAPSWSLLDTGAHLEIHGNAEFDRYTLRGRDYLNFFPFFVAYSMDRQVDMPGVEVLDEMQIPLLIDYFHYPERIQSYQLLQRRVSYRTLRDAFTNRFKTRTMRDLIDEWQAGFSMGVAVTEQTERNAIAALDDPKIRYIDLFNGDFDHVAHLAADPITQRQELEKVDALIGRLWTAIQRSPSAADTLFVVVSDHGMNSNPSVYSQGFSLVRLFNSAEGGGHHVITNRHPLSQYKLRGIDPFVTKVTTASEYSGYLAGQANEYPTAILDLDGNERAGVWLRSNDLNRLQIRLQQLNKGQPRGADRVRLIETFLAERDEWKKQVEPEIRSLRTELGVLRRFVAKEEPELAARQPALKSASVEDQENELRRVLRLKAWKEDDRGYAEYARVIENLMTLGADRMEPGKLNIAGLIPKNAMGDRNSIHDLQNYVAGLNGDGGFRSINYPRFLVSQRVRNNVQEAVSSYPIDFVAVRAPLAGLREALPEADRPDQDGVWLYRDDEHQALLLSRILNGSLWLKYLPVRNLIQDNHGVLSFARAEWTGGFPLALFEDSALQASGDRAAWLSEWHEERDWFRAIHRTKYSNGVIGLQEHFRREPFPDSTSDDEVLRARLTARRSRLRESDLLVFARDHWNFNVRGFNPGGNHGSLLRISTHSVWMMAGAQIPPGVRVSEPYDSLNFMPTLLRLLGIAPIHPLPGHPVDEILDSKWIKTN